MVATKIPADPLPLEKEDNGRIKVQGTRIPLEIIVHAFWAGSTPEQIVQDYSTLKLGDVYAVIGYYLRHRAEMDSYVGQRQELADVIEREVRERFPTDGLRERLLARLANERSEE